MEQKNQMSTSDLLNANLDSHAASVLLGGIERDVIWHCLSDPRFCFHAYVPPYIYDAPESSLKLMVMVHGTGREIEFCRTPELKAFADEHHLAILAPIFPAGLFDMEDLNTYKTVEYRGVRYDQVLLSMIGQIVEKFPAIDSKRVLMAGHSGGGQFVLRFFYLHPDRLQGVSISAPGRPTFLDPESDYYWGIRNFKEIFDKPIDIKSLGQVPVQLVIGEFDTEYIDQKIPFGSNRRERINYLKWNLQENGVRVRLDVVKGRNHINHKDRYLETVMSFFRSVIQNQYEEN